MTDQQYFFIDVRWSPDGQSLLFLTFLREGGYDFVSINLLNGNTGTLQTLIQLPRNNYVNDLEWAPSLDHHLVNYWVYPSYSNWILDTSTGVAKSIGIGNFKWSEDGSAYFRDHGDSRWQRISLDNNKTEDLPQHGGYYFPELDAFVSDFSYFYSPPGPGIENPAVIWFNNASSWKPLVQLELPIEPPNSDCAVRVEQLLLSPDKKQLLIQVKNGVYVVKVADSPLVIDKPIPSYCENGADTTLFGWTPDSTSYLLATDQYDKVNKQMLIPWTLKIINAQTSESVYEYEFPPSIKPQFYGSYRSRPVGIDVIWTTQPQAAAHRLPR